MTSNINKKQPSECTNITEVRNEIDAIDKEIIRLLSNRLQYVHEVVKYKEATATSIEAADRKADVLSTRAQWAIENGLEPEVIQDMYQNLIQYFIDEEKKKKNIK